MAASCNASRLNHVDLTTEGLVLLRLSDLALASSSILLAIPCSRLPLILSREGEVLLRLAFSRRRMLLSIVILARLVALRGLNVWLRGLRLCLRLRAINDLLEVLPACPRCRHVLVGLVPLRLLNQLDDLLRVMQLRVVAQGLAHDELLLVVHVD